MIPCLYPISTPYCPATNSQPLTCVEVEGVGVKVGVIVTVGVVVGVLVGVIVGVVVLVGVLEGVIPGVLAGVDVGVAVALGVTVTLGVGVAVLVGVAVGVCVMPTGQYKVKSQPVPGKGPNTFTVAVVGEDEVLVNETVPDPGDVIVSDGNPLLAKRVSSWD